MNRRQFIATTPALVAALHPRFQSQNVDLIVRGGRVVDPDGVREADVAVHEGRIVAIGRPPAMPEADRVVDASGKYVLPGLIDSHVHFNTPFRGTVTREDFYDGSVAAAYGGTTTYIDFAVQPKGSDLHSVVEARRSGAGKPIQTPLWTTLCTR